MQTLPHWLRVTRTLALGTLSLASTLAACESRTTSTTGPLGSTTSPSVNTANQGTVTTEPVVAPPTTPAREGDPCVLATPTNLQDCNCVQDSSGQPRIQCVQVMEGPLPPPEFGIA
ncbi:MAG: hypothetical protein Q8Q09_19425 [Deltaproteobacteria bacterium]|nr:hypothetical protein [Deltaproteobacteria bacterium]